MFSDLIMRLWREIWFCPWRPSDAGDYSWTKALEMLLDMMNGKEVVSDMVPTRLFGRESFDYDMYDFSAKEIISVDSDFYIQIL